MLYSSGRSGKLLNIKQWHVKQPQQAGRWSSDFLKPWSVNVALDCKLKCSLYDLEKWRALANSVAIWRIWPLYQIESIHVSLFFWVAIVSVCNPVINLFGWNVNLYICLSLLLPFPVTFDQFVLHNFSRKIFNYAQNSAESKEPIKSLSTNMLCLPAWDTKPFLPRSSCTIYQLGVYLLSSCFQCYLPIAHFPSEWIFFFFLNCLNANVLFHLIQLSFNNKNACLFSNW